MFALLNPPRKRGRKRRSKKLSIFTPGGGRIFAANARRANKLFNSNPFFKRRSPAQLGGSIMRKRHRRGRRGVRFNMGSLGGMLSTPKQHGLLDALKPKNLVGVTPILAGVVANGIVTKMLSSKIPYTRGGIGNIALGLVDAGLIGLAARALKQGKIGEGLFVGGVVQTLGCALQSVMQHGLRALSLSGADDHFDERFGMGEFVSPNQIGRAIPSQGGISQYGLPHANAQYMPSAQLSPPPTPAMAAQARGVSDYEAQAAIGAVLGDTPDLGM